MGGEAFRKTADHMQPGAQPGGLCLARLDLLHADLELLLALLQPALDLRLAVREALELRLVLHLAMRDGRLVLVCRRS